MNEKKETFLLTESSRKRQLDMFQGEPSNVIGDEELGFHLHRRMTTMGRE
jgi:hypothetical protein